ncbi:inactive ubiquitin carboxyl-terminal hydrolase MINDY-4B isoform X2 [Lepeophtheirus salmonis]|uniref:inactive ubiquitin carboxyl-terminal hydrolase MINDY-4B isoform X2 n=1 Tax=Lepeophtheirus salmonis TaxID=72036 RepID=UPI003AF346A9
MASNFQSKIKAGTANGSKKSLFQVKISKLIKSDSQVFSSAPHRVVYARAGGEDLIQNGQLNGEPIEPDMAMALKTIVWGSACSQICPYWQGMSFSFHSGGDVNAFGLKCPSNGTKNFLICVQAYILKNLLFDKKAKNSIHQKYGAASKSNRSNQGGGGKTKSEQWTNILRPTDRIQSEILIGGLTSLFSKVSDGHGGILCFPSSDNCFEPTSNYTMDGVTEKLHIFRSDKEEELRSTIKKFLSLITQENGNGLLSILYSLILTRGFDRLKKEMQDQKDTPMIDSNGDCIQPLLNLLLLGRATPYLHNGIMCTDDGDDADPEFSNIEKMGVMNRSELGFLLWEFNEDKTALFNVGSRLKTPIYPIWITCCNQQYGILFNPNKELMKSYQAERRFQLFYYADHRGKKDEVIEETTLTINNSNTNQQNKDLDYGLHDFDEIEENPLEQAIKSKWSAAHIEWNKTTPYVW